jgi:carboxypeptidase Taq
MDRLGFDFRHGRLDTSAHPFCGGVPEDIRITTRYEGGDPSMALGSVIHETGHALYEAGLPRTWLSQPVGRARGMTLHESQSLILEMQLCLSRPWFRAAAPLMREAFSVSGPEWEPENLYRLATRVKRGFIRVDSDEATYPCHIILRTGLERAMLAGELEIEDLPGAFDEGMERLLGIRPPDARLGCLQDIHWPTGSFGYFPCYSLGAIAAAQIFAAARAALPGMAAALEQGDTGPLRRFLAEKIHSRASLLSTDSLLEEATGSALKADAYKAHLTRRYLEDAG